MEFIKFKNFKKALTAQPYFIWNELKQKRWADIEVDANSNESFWNKEIIEADLTAAQVMAKTYNLIDEKVIEYLSFKQDVVILKGEIQKRIIDTQKLLLTDKLIINPAFESGEVLATPFAFDAKEKAIINLNYSSKTKRNNFIRAFFDYSVIKKLITVKKYYTCLPVDINCKKFKLELILVETINPTKTGGLPTETFKNGEEKALNVIDAIKNHNLEFPEFDTVIKLIKESKDATLMNNLTKDVNYWGHNSEWDNLLEELNHPFFGYSGHVLQKKKVAFGEPVTSPLYDQLDSDSPEAIINDFDLVNRYISLIQASKKVTWYDFEGYSLPFAAVENTKSYHQMVFQVSIINSLESKEQEAINKVYDPKTLSKEDLFNIVKDVYQNKSDLYVVYNKAYENTRLKEIVNLLKRENDENYKEAEDMFLHIDNHTLDLYDLFRVTASKTQLPPIVLCDQKGKASIKNIEKYINTHKLSSKIGYKIKEYNSLVIQKGTMAMEVAIKRALNIIGDYEWKSTEKNLKVYCENDVKAMLMVYHLIIFLLKEENVE